MKKVLDKAKEILKHKFAVPVISVVLAILITPISPILGGMCLGVLCYTGAKIIIDSNK
tara:strand:- start:24936 stop:25109 length:174 start_codon:yes stop_codon:yes gene_type:complete